MSSCFCASFEDKKQEDPTLFTELRPMTVHPLSTVNVKSNRVAMNSSNSIASDHADKLDPCLHPNKDGEPCRFFNGGYVAGFPGQPHEIKMKNAAWGNECFYIVLILQGSWFGSQDLGSCA